MNIISAKDIKPNRLTVLIYGTPGMGKTSLLGNLKGRTLIIDIDKGTSVLAGCENVDIVRLANDAELYALINELKAKCPYNNIGLDTISELERTMLAGLASKNNNGVNQIQDYGKTNNSMMNICRQLREVNANIFLTAWEKYTEVYSTSGEKYSRIEPLLRDTVKDNVCGLCDIVGRIYYDKESEERMVWLDGRPNIIAKDRVFKRKSCAFKEVIPWEL